MPTIEVEKIEMTFVDGFLCGIIPVQNKYIRKIYGKFAGPFISENKEVGVLNIDVYDVLKAFEVTCPARQHAIKKLLCSGIRGQKTELDDLLEAKQSIERAIEMAQCEQK